VLADGRALELRPLRPGDADAIARFFAALTEREIYYFYALDEERARQLALDADRDPAYRLAAVDADGAVWGYMYLQWNDDGRAPVYGACLRPGAQSAGLGRAMIACLLGSAAASGVPAARLSVHPDNWRALRLYQRSGFRLTGDFLNEQQGVRQYRMEVDLSQPPPLITDEVTVVPRGGLGLALPAARVQAALEAKLGRRPLVLDRPARPGGALVLVADLGPEATPWGSTTGPAPEPSDGWSARLDACTELIAGNGPDALALAVDRYLAALLASAARDS
jgi:ribosomal protein S18 acetylase RimI-like enzyme